MRRLLLSLFLLTLIVVVVALRNSHFLAAGPAHHAGLPAGEIAEPAARGEASTAVDHEFMLRTGIVAGRMVFVGVGGTIDGIANPDLVVEASTTIRVILANGDGMAHDLAIPDLGVKTKLISAKGATTEVVFAVTPDQVGTYDYICTVSGHRQAGMSGKLSVR